MSKHTDVLPASSMIPYLSAISDGLILCKDASLLAGFAVRGIDLDDSSQSETEQAIESLQTAFSRFDQRFTVWRDSRVQQGSMRPEKYTNGDVMANWERDASDVRFSAADHLEHQDTLWILFSPPQGVTGFLDRMGSHQNDRGLNPMAAAVEAAKDVMSPMRMLAIQRGGIKLATRKFEHALSTFAQTVAALAPQRLTGQAMLRALDGLVNPADETTPDYDGYRPLDVFFARTPLTPGSLRIHARGIRQQKFIAAITVAKWPAYSNSLFIKSLMTLGLPVRLVQSFKFLSQKGRKEVAAQVRFLAFSGVSWAKQAAASATSSTAPEAEDGTADLVGNAREAARRANAEGLPFAFHAVTILVSGDSADECEANVDLLIRALPSFGLFREQEGLQSAFESTMPGNWPMVKRYFLNSAENVADCSLSYYVPLGPPENAFLSKLMVPPK
jgi:type IV secretion system protein TrbE